MVITNNTQHESVYYSVSAKGGGVACGNLLPGDDATLAGFDDTPGVKLTLTISKTGDATEVIIQNPGLISSPSASSSSNS